MYGTAVFLADHIEVRLQDRGGDVFIAARRWLANDQVAGGINGRFEAEIGRPLVQMLAQRGFAF